MQVSLSSEIAEKILRHILRDADSVPSVAEVPSIRDRFFEGSGILGTMWARDFSKLMLAQFRELALIIAAHS
jgi:hypothetical protein